jgi:hypothetical protein
MRIAGRPPPDAWLQAEATPVRTVGIRTFGNRATTLLNSNETLLVEHNGTPVGVYIPLAAKDRAAQARSLADFRSYLQRFLAEHGLTEEELVRALAEPTGHDELEPTADAPGR